MYKNFLQTFANPSLLTMFLFGISSGLPAILVSSTLKLWATTIGVSITSVAAFTWITLPYLIKFLWAPFIDGVRIPYLRELLGHRRSWLLLVQCVLLLVIVLLATCIREQNVLSCCIVATIVAFLSATQDTVFDAYRIVKLPKDLQALGLSTYISGYRLAAYAASVGMLVLADKLSWAAAYYIAALAMLVGIVATLSCAEPKYIEEKALNQKLSFIESFTETVVRPFKEFSSIRGWHYVILFAILFKLGDAVLGNLTLTFLKIKGFSLEELASYVKTYSLVAAIIGAFLGSIILKKCSLLISLLLSAAFQILANTVFLYQDYVGYNHVALTLTIFAEGIAWGAGDVIFARYISSLCSVQFAGTQYALLLAFASTGRIILVGFSGFIVESYGWSNFFIMCIALAIPGILLIFKVVNIKRDL